LNIRTYTAAKMAEALAMVKRDLGPQAVILHTRTFKRGGLLGLGSRGVVEITATDSPSMRRTRRRASRTATTHVAAGNLIRNTYAPRGVPPRTASTAVAHHGSAEPIAIVNRSAPSISASTVPVAAPATSSPSLNVDSVTGPAHDQLAEEVSSVKRMVARMMRQQRQRRVRAGGKPDLPDKLFNQYLRLLEQEVTEELAEQIIQQVHDLLDSEQLQDEQTVRRAVMERVARLIPTVGGEELLAARVGNRPKTVALIGPTGVGKTTTIAKLAANFKLKQKKNVALITIDTYRIAAVDQLRTYANIIGVPLHVVASPQQLTSALRKCIGCDVVLIDTAGRSQADQTKLDQLAEFIAAAEPHEVHLVLSSTCTQTVLLDTIARFSKIQTDRIIFTKLDEAVTFGVLFNVSRKVNKRLSFLTTGQDVPYHIEPSRSERIAAMVLGEGP